MLWWPQAVAIWIVGGMGATLHKRSFCYCKYIQHRGLFDASRARNRLISFRLCLQAVVIWIVGGMRATPHNRLIVDC